MSGNDVTIVAGSARLAQPANTTPRMRGVHVCTQTAVSSYITCVFKWQLCYGTSFVSLSLTSPLSALLYPRHTSEFAVIRVAIVLIELLNHV
jgi:hypothetical protein